MDETEARFRALERKLDAVDMVVSGVFAAMVRDRTLQPEHLRMVARVFEAAARDSHTAFSRAGNVAIADLAKTILAIADVPEFTADLRIVHDADRDPPEEERE